MIDWKAIGVMLRDVDERALVMDAASRCGLRPVEVTEPSASQLYRTAQKLSRVNAARESQASEQLWLPMMVVDELAPVKQWKADVHSGAGLFSAIVMVQDETRKPGIGSYGAPGYAWALVRPLQLEAVQAQIQQAVQANRVFVRQYREVLEELNRARTIFQSVSNGISIADATQEDLPLVYVNRAFEQMTGYQANEIYGRNCRFLQGEERDQPGVAQIRRAILRREPVRVQLRNFRKDGRLFWNELYLSPIRDMDGEVTHYAGIQNDVTERVEATERLSYLALHDALTGLANRSLLIDRFDQALEQARRSGKIVAVLFFDLNNFKQLNHTLGHEAGDLLLKTVALRLRESARSCETVARLDSISRLGGDEFVVILEGLSDETLHKQVMRRFLRKLSEPTEILGMTVVPTTSIGVALFPRDGETAEELLRAADADMHRAKRAGEI